MDTRVPLIIVGGYSDGVKLLGDGLLDAGTVLVRHDLALLGQGLVTRTVTMAEREWIGVRTLDHGCVSCTLRADLLPLLRTLAQSDTVARIVVLLDAALEPVELCHAIDEVVVSGMVGRIDAPAGHEVRVSAIVTAIDAETWLADATGADTIADRRDLGEDDNRTVAQVTVAQAEHADVLAVFGTAADHEVPVLHAVWERLAPQAAVHWITSSADLRTAIAAVPTAPRGRLRFDPYAGLLAGMPPLHLSAGVALVEFNADRPFHPERLHEAIDVLLDGVVTARGRIWLATQPDYLLWLDSAGGGLRVGPEGRWVASLQPEEVAAHDPDRLAWAALRWDATFGDRHCALVVLSHQADPDEIGRALRWALVTDDELAHPASWRTWADPFGQWHEDPCGDTSATLPEHTNSEGEQQ